MTNMQKPKLTWSQTMDQIEIKIHLPFEVIKSMDLLKNGSCCVEQDLLKFEFLDHDGTMNEKYSFQLDLVKCRLGREKNFTKKYKNAANCEKQYE